jgi:hypothetical protein
MQPEIEEMQYVKIKRGKDLQSLLRNFVLLGVLRVKKPLDSQVT